MKSKIQISTDRKAFNDIKLARALFKTVEQGADTSVYLASSNDLKNSSGHYFMNRKQAKVADKYYVIKNRCH